MRMHLTRLLLFVLALMVGVPAVAADVKLVARGLEPDPAEAGVAPQLELTVIGVSPLDVGSYSVRQTDRTQPAIKATQLIPFIEGNEPIAMAIVVLSDGNFFGYEGRTDVRDGVMAAIHRLATAGPPGSMATVVTYAKDATVAKAGVPLADLATFEVTADTSGPVAGRALVTGLTLGAAELAKLTPARKVLVVIGDFIDGDGGTAPSTPVRDLGRKLAEQGVQAAAIVYQPRGAAFREPGDVMKLDPVTRLQVHDEEAELVAQRTWEQVRKQAIEDAKYFTQDRVKTFTSIASGFPGAADNVATGIADRFYLRFPGYDKRTKARLTWDGKEHPLVLRVDGNDLAKVEATLAPAWSPPGGGSPWWLFVVIPIGLLAVAGAVVAVVRKPKPAAGPGPEAVAAAAAPTAGAPGAPGMAPGAPGGAPPAAGKAQKTQFINIGGDDVFPVVGWLVFLNGPQRFKTHKLASGVTKVGTSKESDISIDDGYMSTNHALVVVSADGFTLQDNSSTNGTFVNNARVAKHELADGDVVMFGRTQLKFKATI
ncbi:MAG: FHA domain-containing protein [Kofleriaceae bacterium]